MKILLISPEYPDTFWSFKHAVPFIRRKASSPPLGLLTVAAMLPAEWERRLVDLNVGRLTEADLTWADMAFVGAMTAQRRSARAVIARCRAAGVTVVAGGPLFRLGLGDLRKSTARAPRVLKDALTSLLRGEGRSVIETLVRAKPLEGITLIAAVSEDVALEDRESLLWGIFTRFDPARDILFSSAELRGAWPVYHGCLGVDATFKSGYPDPVEMDQAIVRRVDARWVQYWAA